MKTYDKYKSSGIDWIGDIPEHWELKRLKFFAKVNSSIPSFVIDKSSDDEVVFLPMEKVSEGGEIDQELRKQINEVNSGFTYFEKDDVILAKITPCFENGKGAFLENLETDFGFGSTEFHTLRATETVSAKLLFYITKSHSFRTLGEAFMSGSAGQKRVSTDFVKDFPIAFPSLEEQTAIADYLDEKTAQIDKLIAGKRGLIELLKEERLGVINQAVTRGINPHAKLKPSGIAWLGDIPEHWEVKKLRYVANKVLTGSTPPSSREDYYYEAEVNWFTPSDFSDRLLLTNSKRKISESAIKDDVVKMFPANSILFVGIGATLGKVGYIEKPASSNQQINAITMDSLEKTKFYAYFFNVNQLNIVALANAATLAILNQAQTKDIPLTEPPLEEQKQIVEFIETATSKIDATIAKIEKEIGFLGEYRTALISEVVTGKIKVV